jgi:lipoprotein-releasing system permease protein
LNFSFYIAKKAGITSKKSFSNIIIRIAVVAIALSITVMIIASSTVRGFKQSISEKVFGFWGHIHITSSYAPNSFAFETSPMNISQNYVDELKKLEKAKILVEEYNFWGQPTQKLKESVSGIKQIQSFAQKEGIIKAGDQIEGIILRGVGKDYDWNFLKKYIKSGKPIDFSNENHRKQILISETTAKRMKLSIGSSFQINFIQNGGSYSKKCVVQGIFKTGLEEYDKRFAIVPISVIQELNNWRPYRSYFQPEILNQDLILYPVLENNLDGQRDALEQSLVAGQIPDFTQDQDAVLVSEKWATLNKKGSGDTIKLNLSAKGESPFFYPFTIHGIFLSEPNTNWDKTILCSSLYLTHLNRMMPEQISGFEVFTYKIQDIDLIGAYINNEVLLNKGQYANTIKELEPNIFDWLNLTDMNERIILALMILVSLINMTTSLLILILERTNMIGILKALGATHWTIRKIFLYHSFQISLLGILFGNIFGIGLCLIQKYTGIITLPEDMYYVSVAPIQIDFFHIIAMNLCTVLISVVVMILPTWLIVRISPIKAIRFK